MWNMAGKAYQTPEFRGFSWCSFTENVPPCILHILSKISLSMLISITCFPIHTLLSWPVRKQVLKVLGFAPTWMVIGWFSSSAPQWPSSANTSDCCQWESTWQWETWHGADMERVGVSSIIHLFTVQPYTGKVHSNFHSFLQSFIQPPIKGKFWQTAEHSVLPCIYSLYKFIFHCIHFVCISHIAIQVYGCLFVQCTTSPLQRKLLTPT